MSKKAVQYDSAKKVHETVEKLDPSLLPISSDDGNFLESRSNGLYYGNKASKELNNLYVSSVSGSDSTGDGTKNNPYKTIRKALSVVPSHVSYTLHLKAGETFIWTSTDSEIAQNKYITNGATVTVVTYGDPVVEKKVTITPEAAQYNGRSSNKALCAKLYLGVMQNSRTSNNKYGRPSFYPLFGTTINFWNIEFHTKGILNIAELKEKFYGAEDAPDLGYWSGSFVYGDRGNVSYRNCSFIHDADEEASKVKFISSSSRGAGVSANFERCFYQKTSRAINEADFSYGLFNIQTGASLNVDGHVSGDDYLHYFGETLAEENLKSSFQSIPNLLYGFTKDSKGTLQNCLLNFNPAS